MTHKTKPSYYDGQLSADASRNRADSEDKLDELYEELRDASGMDKLRMQKRLNAAEQQLDWQGANPKHIPFGELRDHIRSPVTSDSVENKYKARIKNRATGIRAYCVWCMGGHVAGVRDCPAITCPLHAFRGGKDPLRGWDIPKVEMPIIDDEDDLVDAFEEGDDGDETDARN